MFHTIFFLSDDKETFADAGVTSAFIMGPLMDRKMTTENVASSKGKGRKKSIPYLLKNGRWTSHDSN
jgi:hypothetical protein